MILQRFSCSHHDEESSDEGENYARSGAGRPALGNRRRFGALRRRRYVCKTIQRYLWSLLILRWNTRRRTHSLRGWMKLPTFIGCPFTQPHTAYVVNWRVARVLGRRALCRQDLLLVGGGCCQPASLYCILALFSFVWCWSVAVAAAVAIAPVVVDDILLLV